MTSKRKHILPIRQYSLPYLERDVLADPNDVRVIMRNYLVGQVLIAPVESQIAADRLADGELVRRRDGRPRQGDDTGRPRALGIRPHGDLVVGAVMHLEWKLDGSVAARLQAYVGRSAQRRVADVDEVAQTVRIALQTRFCKANY